MKAYKEKLQARMKLVLLFAVLAALVFGLLTIYSDHLPVLPSFIKGFNQGAFFGFEIIALLYFIQCMKARKSEDKMQKMYIEETDERTNQIIRNASTLGIAVIFIGLGIAVIISGFFSATIFFTLMACLIFILIVFYVLWIYYAKKV